MRGREEEEEEETCNNQEKRRFYEQICSSNNNNKISRKDFTKEKLEKYIHVLLSRRNDKKTTTMTTKLTPKEYYICRNFATKKFRDKWILIDKKKEIETMTPPYIYYEEIYDIVKLAHLTSVHGGIRRTLEEAKKLASNVKLLHVKIYTSLCKKCQSLKKKNPIKIPVTKPIISKEFGQRGQVDLMDTRNFKGNEKCNFILNYQDNKTKFCILRALTDKTPDTVIGVLEDIFGLFGAPKILHTDNGGEFVNKKLKNYLSRVWPDIIHVRGKPYNPRSQGSVERANRQVKDILKRWSLENDPGSDDNLKKSLPYIQYIKNTYYHRMIKMTPYEALFGQEPPVPINLIKRIVVVDDDDDDDDDDAFLDTS